MNYSEVKELLQAGFTAEEIRAMMNNPQNPQDNPQNQQEPQPAEPEVKPEGQPEVKPEEDDNRFTQLNQTMEKLIKTIQSSNLQNASFDKRTEPDLNSEVDKIMGSIIRPEERKENH